MSLWAWLLSKAKPAHPSPHTPLTCSGPLCDSKRLMHASAEACLSEQPAARPTLAAVAQQLAAIRVVVADEAGSRPASGVLRDEVRQRVQHLEGKMQRCLSRAAARKAGSGPIQLAQGQRHGGGPGSLDLPLAAVVSPFAGSFSEDADG